MKIAKQMATALLVWASMVGVAHGEQPEVGRRAAQKYFRKPNAVEVRDDDDSSSSRGGGGSLDHFLALHFGTYVSSQSYAWGKSGDQAGIGKQDIGVTYKLTEYSNSVDLMIRVDLQWFQLEDGAPSKLGFLPMLIFPEATSRFPLYFGIGAGPGVYLKQLQGESSLSFDYQLIAGARLFNVYQNTGFTLETGLKNHLHLLSNGQFNGVFLAVGGVFTF